MASISGAVKPCCALLRSMSITPTLGSTAFDAARCFNSNFLYRPTAAACQLSIEGVAEPKTMGMFN